MLTNSDCTVYRYNKLTQGFDRLYIPAVMWQESKASNVAKSGMQSSGVVSVFIDSAYARSAPQTTAKDMLVKGNCPFEFDNRDEQSISNSMKAFRAEYSFVTVASIADYLFGSLPHVEITAK